MPYLSISSNLNISSLFPVACGSWVAVVWESDWYLGLVEKSTANHRYLVNCLEYVQDTTFRFPSRKDKNWFASSEIIEYDIIVESVRNKMFSLPIDMFTALDAKLKKF